MKISQDFYIFPYNTDILECKLGGIFQKNLEKLKRGSYISHEKGNFSGYFLEISQIFHLRAFITSVIAVEK